METGFAGVVLVLPTKGLPVVLALACVDPVLFFVAMGCLWAVLARVAWRAFAGVAAGLVVAGCCFKAVGCCECAAVAVKRLAPSTVAIKRVFICVAGFYAPEKTGAVSRCKSSVFVNLGGSASHQFNGIGKGFRRSLSAV